MIPEPGIYDITEGHHVFIRYSGQSPIFVFIKTKALEQFKQGEPAVSLLFVTPSRYSEMFCNLGAAGTIFHVIIEEKFNSKSVSPTQFLTHPSPQIRQAAKDF